MTSAFVHVHLLVSALAASEDPRAAEVRAALARVLARPEFDRSPPPWGGWLDRIIAAVERWFSASGIDPSQAGRFAAGVVYGGLILLAASLVLFGTRALWLAQRARKNTPSVDRPHPGRARARELCAEAALARARGDHLAAVRLYFRALVLGLSEHGALEYKDAWTNRELVERGAPPPEIESVLRARLAKLDAQSFGHRPTEAEDVREWALLVERHLGIEAA